MAAKQQLKDLPVGTIVNDKISNTQYILLSTKYKITPGKTSDGVLLGFYKSDTMQYFPSKVFEKDSLGKLYNESDIKELLNSAPTDLKISSRLKEYIIPTMIASNKNIYDIIGPMLLFLPSLIEIGQTPDNTNAVITGVAIDTTNIKIKEYINNIKSFKTLMRNSYDLDVYLSNNTQISMNTEQNMIYFLCVDPTIYIGMDEENNYCLFDNFINSKKELNIAIEQAKDLISRYNKVEELKDSIDALNKLILDAEKITDSDDQSLVNQLTQDILDSIMLLESQIQAYENLNNRIILNSSSTKELIKIIDDFLLVLTRTNNISNPAIQKEINSLNALKIELKAKSENITNKIEQPMSIADLNLYLDTKYSSYFSLENAINQKLFVNDTLIESITELGKLVQESVMLMAKYTLIDKTVLQLAIDDANVILGSQNPTISIVQNSIVRLSEQKQNFINNITFEIDNLSPVVEIGIFGRRPSVNINVKNNTGGIINVLSENKNIAVINSPVVDTEIEPVGSVNQYTIVGVSEGTTIINFTILDNDISKTIAIPVVVSQRDTLDPNYLDLIDDISKVSIQQIDSGIKDINGLGERLELIEEKLFGSSSTLDTNLLNILNTTTPTPVLNKIETAIVKDADITEGKSTIINLQNIYYMNQNHLMVYRNGVYQQVGIRYKEKTNNSVEFSKNYLIPGDKLLFISSYNGMHDLSNVSIEYTEGGLITKIKFFKNDIIFREMEYIYDEDPKIIEQIIHDEVYTFRKIFTYNINNFVSNVSIEIISK